MNIVNGFIVFVPNKNPLSIAQEWVTWLSSICADGSVIYLGVLSPPSEWLLILALCLTILPNIGYSIWLDNLYLH